MFLASALVRKQLSTEAGLNPYSLAEPRMPASGRNLTRDAALLDRRAKGERRTLCVVRACLDLEGAIRSRRHVKLPIDEDIRELGLDIFGDGTAGSLAACGAEYDQNTSGSGSDR